MIHFGVIIINLITWVHGIIIITTTLFIVGDTRMKCIEDMVIGIICTDHGVMEVIGDTIIIGDMVVSITIFTKD
jgi:hypothetical protein